MSGGGKRSLGRGSKEEERGSELRLTRVELQKGPDLLGRGLGGPEAGLRENGGGAGAESWVGVGGALGGRWLDIQGAWDLKPGWGRSRGHGRGSGRTERGWDGGMGGAP